MTSPSNRDLLAVVRAWVASNYPGCSLESIAIRCTFLSRPIVLASGPGTAPRDDEEPNPSHEPQGRIRSADIPDCVQEILKTLREVKKPLTQTLLMEEMAQRGFTWDRRTLAGFLSELVKEGTLENNKGAKPPGYRLTSPNFDYGP